jgi:PQQ-like domain
MQRIPRGVAHDDRLAVVATRAGELIALNPTTGAVRWRQGRGLRPCAVTATALVGVRGDDPNGPAIVVLDSEDGRELWTAPLPAVPHWAYRDITDDPTIATTCTVEGEQVILRWVATSRYAGGAAPGARVLREHTREAHGAVRVDLPSRSLQPAAPDDPVVRDQDRALTAAATASGDLGADVLEAGRIGGVRVELAAPAATDAVVLRGVDAADDAVIWELALDEKARRPPHLRP